jgi:arsenite methyltransferase
LNSQALDNRDEASSTRSRKLVQNRHHKRFYKKRNAVALFLHIVHHQRPKCFDRHHLTYHPLSTRSKKPNYGIDAPKLGLTLVACFIALVTSGFLLARSNSPVAQSAGSIVLSLVPTGVLLLLLIVLYIKVEKFRHRDRMLNLVSWKGDEQVLDIGTGKGLLLIGAAKRLVSGKSIGIDIWNSSDLSSNSYESAMRNAEIEGVTDRVLIQNADAQQIPFANQSFTYVLSNLCLHNIDSKAGRATACQEIARVLKPGGVALVSDFMHTSQYAAEFKKLGMDTSRSFSFLAAPVLLYIVKATKKK